VVDEVDCFDVTFELGDQPIGVALHGQLIALRHEAAKVRHAERDVVVSRKVISQMGPDPLCLGDSVDEQALHLAKATARAS